MTKYHIQYYMVKQFNREAFDHKCNELQENGFTPLWPPQILLERPGNLINETTHCYFQQWTKSIPVEEPDKITSSDHDNSEEKYYQSKR